MMKCVIIDDEPLAAKVISNHIAKTAGLELIKSFENAFEALYYIQTRVVDIVFLDIQMPGINGIQFIKILKYRPQLIVTTAYREYALAALEVGVTDYLLKPISYERFLQAISKVLESPPLTVTAPNVATAPTLENLIYIKTDVAYERLDLRDLLYIKGEKSYSQIVTTDQRHVVSGNLAYYQSRLPAPRFLRIHKSYLIATDQIRGFTSTHVHMGGSQLPIGRTYKRQLMHYLEPLKW